MLIVKLHWVTQSITHSVVHKPAKHDDSPDPEVTSLHTDINHVCLCVCVCVCTDLITDLFDSLHAEVFHSDPFGVFADPSPLRDLIDSERLPPLPTAGQAAALHYGLHLKTGERGRQVKQTGETGTENKNIHKST